MPRIPDIRRREDVPEDKRHIFDAIGEEMGSVVVPFSVLLNSPEVAGRMSSLRKYLFFESAIPPLEKHLIMLIAGRETDWIYGWGRVVIWSRDVGVREEAIDAIGRRLPLDAFTEEEAVLVAYGREMIGNHRVSDATFEAARARYGNKCLTEITAMLGYYAGIALMLNAFEVEERAGVPHLP
ncbi:MAG: hypothetical protein Q7O66_22425 [Dehalococcoidia bacterium]|nr:hypothetical protein [Dehalococcoidia bacterium]